MCPGPKIFGYIFWAALLSLVLNSAAVAQPVSVKEDPDASRAHLNAGNALLMRNSFQEALDEYQKALDLNHNNTAARANIVLAHNNWGIAYFQQKKYEQARQQWQTALQLDATDRKASYNLQLLQRKLGELKPPSNPEESWPSSPASTGDKAKSDNSKTPAASVKLLTPLTTKQVDKESAVPLLSPAAAKKVEDPEEMLSKLETKIYGSKAETGAIMQRLEKIEQDTFGQSSSGSIKERLEGLYCKWNL